MGNPSIYRLLHVEWKKISRFVKPNLIRFPFTSKTNKTLKETPRKLLDSQGRTSFTSKEQLRLFILLEFMR